MKLKRCRSCNSNLLISILSLGNQYLSDFSKNNTKPKAFPLNIVLCKNCKLVQLDYTTPSKYLYTERYGYRSGINQTMKDELKNVVNQSLDMVKITNKKIVAVDIGANDGTLLSFYPKKVFRIGVEPIKKFAKETKKNAEIVVNDFFNFNSYNIKAKNIKADLITVISCFYDMEKPNQFVKDLKKIMNEDAILVIQQNYLVEMLKKNAFDNIVHEHLEYYSYTSLSYLLKNHGLEIFDVEIRDLNGGSFRTYIAKIGNKPISQRVKKMQEMEKKLKLNNKYVYLKFAKRIRQNKNKLLKLIREFKTDGKNVYLYGASTRGNTLLQYFELDSTLIQKAVERNPEKWGKKISSVGIPIISEQEARKEKPEYMLVLPWFFKEEFLKRETSYLKSGGHFIFPLPKMEII